MEDGLTLPDNLPAEVSVTVFAKYASCSRSTVCEMIRKRVITARVLNPVSKRPTYRIPTWTLRQFLGIKERRVSRHFGPL